MPTSITPLLLLLLLLTAPPRPSEEALGLDPVRFLPLLLLLLLLLLLSSKSGW
jgi:hypothetical protein